jgi:hypothetical protein
MQLCFVSVHGPRETYFVDEPRNRWWCPGLQQRADARKLRFVSCLLHTGLFDPRVGDDPFLRSVERL